MGLYQLSRLYYCFSNNQIHSDKGYPLWFFIIMYTIGIVIAALWIFYHLFFDHADCFRSNCTINSKLMYQYEPMHPYSASNAIPWYTVCSVLIVFWDISTLCFYIYKIHGFNRLKETENETDPTIHKRIMNILYKIFILTVMYQVPMMIGVLCTPLILFYNLDALFWFNGFSFSIGLNLSMYLMMDHNHKEYIKFLKKIQSLRLHFICCKWRYIVRDQLANYHDEILKDHTEESKQTTKTSKHNKMRTNVRSLGISLSVVNRRCAPQMLRLDAKKQIKEKTGKKNVSVATPSMMTSSNSNKPSARR